MILGRGDSEISSTLNAMRLEEQARAALAEANYRVHQGEKLECLHSLEGEIWIWGVFQILRGVSV